MGSRTRRSPFKLWGRIEGIQSFPSSWRRAIFPQGSPCSIVTAVEFHHQVRDGSVWFLHAWDTRISTRERRKAYEMSILVSSYEALIPEGTPEGRRRCTFQAENIPLTCLSIPRMDGEAGRNPYLRSASRLMLSNDRIIGGIGWSSGSVYAGTRFKSLGLLGCLSCIHYCTSTWHLSWW